MIYKGSNLIISSDGTVLGGSKSCSIDVQTDLIKVSSPTDGQWEHNIAGRKSWSISTNHLLISSEKATAIIEAQSYGKGMLANQPYLKIGNLTQSVAITRGVKIYAVSRHSSGVYMITAGSNFDTYGNTLTGSNTACDNFAEYLQNTWIPQHMTDWHVIISYGGFGINENLRTKLEGLFNVSILDTAVARYQGSMVLIGYYRDYPGVFTYTTGNAPVAAARESMMLNGMDPLSKTLMSDFAKNAGKTFLLTASIEGNPYDKLSGTAICKTAKLQATKGNLLTGSLQFEGSGPLT